MKSFVSLLLVTTVAANNLRTESAKLVLEPPLEGVTFAIDVIGPADSYNCVAKEDFTMTCTSTSGQVSD